MKHSALRSGLLACILLWMTPWLLAGQSDSQRDSLYQILDKEKGIARIDPLKNIFYLVYKKNPKEGLQISKELAQLALAYEQEDDLLDSYLFKGNCHRLLAQYDSVQLLLDKGFQLAHRKQNRSALGQLSNLQGIVYEETSSSLDSAIYHYEKAIEYGGVNPLSLYNNMGLACSRRGMIVQAIQYLEEGLEIAQKEGNLGAQAAMANNIAGAHSKIDNPEKAKEYALKSLELKGRIGDERGKIFALFTLVSLDPPKKERNAYIQQGIEISNTVGDSVFIRGWAAVLAMAKLEEGKYNQALALAVPAYKGGKRTKTYDFYESLIAMTQIHIELGRYDEALIYALEMKAMADKASSVEQIRKANVFLLEIYEAQEDYEKYYEIANEHFPMVDSLRQKAAIDRLAYLDNKLKSTEQEKQIQLLNNSLQQETINRFWVMALAISTVLILSIILYFRIRQIKTQKQTIAKEQEISKKLEALNQEILKAQDQLVVQEKLASLGQLTAGIAHEIKNPLNFVNNFAQDSTELLDELKTEINQQQKQVGTNSVEEIDQIIGSLHQNVNDIYRNGTRIDRIVRSMMDHARDTQSEPQMVDLNELVNDNINLAYHGYRALDSSFDVHIKKQFDKGLGKTYVHPQELGRVLLNLLNNACYAVQQKQRSNGLSYRPAIQVYTGMEEDLVCIRIRDNGPGIPAEIRQKIFAPFFTTKPTGEGNTGLGLSISYDIIVQQHRGSIDIESEANEFTEFIIRIPIRQPKE